MGLLDYFRKRGPGGPVDIATHAHAGHHVDDVPLGVNDPGALSGDDADEVVAGHDNGDDDSEAE